jgi:pre-mRNA-splicing factor ATP-dependent RNA helicase DHX15/PRP43
MNKHLGFNDKIGILDSNGINDNPLTGKKYTELYHTFSPDWSALPAYTMAKDILETIRDYPLTFVISGTGSGKTVLIPKFALHYTNYSGKIGITLPKRSVTVTQAEYASDTLDVKLGEQVGYVHKGSDPSMESDTNNLLYMTDGTLVMKFVRDPLLSDFDVIIIDEAHERKVQIDLLLLFLKKILESGKRPDLRVIIMSATIDGAKYQKYFDPVQSKIINISGKPNYPIETVYLNEPTRSYIPTGLEIVDTIVKTKPKKDIIFFATTSNETIQLCRNIRAKYSKLFCAELYAEADMSTRAYAISKDKYKETGVYDQKIVMATNLAESSITIDGLGYVIDPCYELYNRYDFKTMANILETKLITKASALQRRGRVGRTESGTCYVLLTKNQFDALEDYPDPDILRQDITINILTTIQTTNTKTLKEGLQYLSQLMDPPKKEFIDIATTLFSDYNLINNNGLITKVGEHITTMSSLPINRSLFLIYAFQLHCGKQASIIIASTDLLGGKITNAFFRKPASDCGSNCEMYDPTEYIKKIAHKRGDHLSYLNLFNEFTDAKDKKEWATKNKIRLDIMGKISVESRKLFGKLMNNMKNVKQIGGAKSNSPEKNLITALKMSHKHQIAKKMTSTYPQEKISGQLVKDSTAFKLYGRQGLQNKTFVYDKLACINGSWEFNSVTII